MAFLLNILFSVLLVLPIAFILNLLFRKKFSKFKYPFLMCVIIGYFVFGLASIFYIISSDLAFFSAERKKFNKQEWFSNKSERYKMVEDIKDQGILIGMSKSDISKFLGNSDEERIEFSSYLIGFSGSLYPKFYFLKVYYKNDVAIKVESYAKEDN